MLSGEGARIYGGRWNSPGTRMIYLGSSLALAAIEQLIHLDNAAILDSYRRLEVRFPADCLAELDISELPDDWDDPNTLSPSCQLTGDAWVKEQISLALRVPSIAVQGDWNYLLNPDHPDFNMLDVGEILPFRYDARLSHIARKQS